MSCNLEQALAKVEKLLKFSAIQKNIPFEIRRIKFEIEAMMAAKKRMLEGPTDETYTTEKVKIDHGTDYTKLITSLENRVKDYVKYVTKDTKNINVHRSTKDANGQTKYLPFGNPFSRYTTGEVDDSILSAMFYRWVVNNEVPASFLSEESTDTRAKRLGGINSARRKIIDELKNIAGKELYYEGTARGKNLSHASTLALIADLYGKGSLTINSNARQNVLTKSTTNKVGQSTENKQTSSIEPKKISRKPEGFKDIGGKEKKPKWLTDTEITFEDIINETEAAIANLPEGYKGAMSGPHVYDGDSNPFWDRDQYLAKYLDKGLEVGDIKDRVIKLVNAGIYNREEEAKVYSKGIEFFEKMVKELKLDEKSEKNVTKFNIQKLIGTLRNSLKTVDEDTEASLYIEAKKYFNKNGFDGTIEEVLKIEPKTHLGLVHFVNLHKAIDPNSEESLKYERLKYEQVLVDLEKKAKKVLAKEDYSDRDKQMIIQSIERDVNDTKNIIKEINSKQNKKIKKDSLTIDVTPIELPYGASNDNNSKTSRPTPENENFDKDLDTKLRDTLTKLYPEIKLEYTEDEIQYIDSNGNVMNQEEASNLVNYTLKVVDTLYDIGTPKKSKHGGNSQPVRSTIKLNSKENPNIEVNLTKYLAGKGVSKEQIEYMFEYMRQNDIQEIGTIDLAERLLFGLTQNVEIETTMEVVESDKLANDERTLGRLKAKLPGKLEKLQESTEKRKMDPEYNAIGYSRLEAEVSQIKEHIATLEERVKQGVGKKPTKHYGSLKVPGGTNYKEIEIKTPSVKAELKGHANFATDEGIGWYRVDDKAVTIEAQSALKGTGLNAETEEGFNYLEDNGYTNFRYNSEGTALVDETETKSNTLRILEMQSDMFQKRKDVNLSKSSYIVPMTQAYTTITGDVDVTDNKAFKYFQEKGANIINKEDGQYIDLGMVDANLSKAFHQILNTDNKWVKFFIQSIVQNAQRNGYEKILFPNGDTVAKIEGYTEEHGSEAVKTFYQTRVQNTLKNLYGTDKVKTVTDEHGNKWFELELYSKRDSQAIMLQQQGGKIKGQANIEAGTVLINSLLQSQDTLPHEYAHHYIAWFRDTPIVQEAIKKWGSEEALVQAIGEQVVKQKGEAYGWWKKFSQWLTGLVSLDSATKKELKDFLTDAFLTRADLREKVKNDTSKGETPKAAAGKSGIEGLKSQQGDAAVNSKEDLDKYTVNGAELAIDEYLAPDSTPEASTKYENSIIQNNEPKTKHTEIRDDIKKCLLKIGSK